MFFRASIIPYTWIRGELYIGLGVDSRYKELADFGGKSDFYDQQHLSTAIREFVEETSAPIDFDFETLIKLENKQHAVFIIRTMPYVMTNYIQYINNREISQALVIKWSDFSSIVEGSSYKGYKMWSSLANLLKPELESLKAKIIADLEEPVPLIPDIVHIQEQELFCNSKLLPSVIGESNRRYILATEGVCMTKHEFLTSNYVRPHLRQSSS
jgi:hypothetical protein